MEAEIRRVCGPDAAAGYGRLRTWLTQLYHAEIDRFIGANFDSPLGLLGPDLARLAALGGFGRLAPADRPVPARRAVAADLLLPGPLRGRAAAAGAGRVRRDRLHGHDRRGVLPPRWDAPGRPGDRRRGGRRRRRDRLRARGDGAGAVGRARHRGPPPGRRRRRRASAWPATRSCSPRTCRWCTGCSAGPRAVPCRCAGRPARSYCTPGSPAPAPTWRTTRSRSARRGSRRSGRSSTRAG